MSRGVFSRRSGAVVIGRFLKSPLAVGSSALDSCGALTFRCHAVCLGFYLVPIPNELNHDGSGGRRPGRCPAEAEARRQKPEQLDESRSRAIADQVRQKIALPLLGAEHRFAEVSPTHQINSI